MQSLDPVGVVAGLVAILLDLSKLVSLNKTLDNCILISTALEDLKSQLRVDCLKHLSEFGGHSELVLLHPLLDHVDLLLLDDRSAKLLGLLLIELH